MAIKVKKRQPVLPKWSTLERRALMVDLFTRSNGFCVFGHRQCLDPSHHYVNFVDSCVDFWITDDRDTDKALWLAELKAMHNLAERGAIKGMFNAIARDIYHDKQPLFYPICQGLNIFTYRPFYKVRLASSQKHLYVDITEAVHGVGKNAKRKYIRYGKPLDRAIRAKIDDACYQAVKEYLK